MGKIFTIIFLVLLSIGCAREFKKPQWEVDAVAPLLNANLGLKNIISDTLFTESNDSILIVYTQKLDAISLDSIAAINVAPFIKNVKLVSCQSLVDG